MKDDRSHKSDFAFLLHSLTTAANLTQSNHIIPIFIYHTFTYKTATPISLILMGLTFLKLSKCVTFSELNSESSPFRGKPIPVLLNRSQPRLLLLFKGLCVHDSVLFPMGQSMTPIIIYIHLYTQRHTFAHRHMHNAHQCSDQYCHKLSASYVSRTESSLIRRLPSHLPRW